MREKPKPTKLSKELSKRIENEFGAICEPIIYRTYAGRHGISAGSWRWFMLAKDKETNNSLQVGSADRATDVLKAKDLGSIRANCVGLDIIVNDVIAVNEDNAVHEQVMPDTEEKDRQKTGKDGIEESK